MSDTVQAFFLGEGETLMDTLKYMLTGAVAEVSEPAAEGARITVGFWTLMPSAFITWIFAKSIYNAAVLGGRFGVMGGVAYAGWYTSFWSAALVGYWLRTRKGVRSLPQVIEQVYGPMANLCFSLALFFRLWNEVWSNILVVANFFGATYTAPWWTAAIVSAAVPATYVLMGGMRASLVSDVLQAGLGVAFLFVILERIGREMELDLANSTSPVGAVASDSMVVTSVGSDVWSWAPDGGWLPGGSTCLMAALLQGFVSYPFHDPVLTDRAFLSRPRTMLASLFVGGAVAMMFIVLFSAVGIYACFLQNAVGKGNPEVVSNHLGGAFEVCMVFVMMTSSLSTLDSTFTSASKLFALEVMGWFRLPGDKRPPGVRGTLAATDASVTTLHVALGRFMIVFLCILGTVFLEIGRETDALKATTVSGTMVMGLGPPVYLACFWKYNSKPGANDGFRKAPLAFLFSFAPGVFFGIGYMAATWSRGPNQGLADALASTAMGEGMYAKFFGWNVVGHAVCLVGTLVGFGIHQLFKLGAPIDAEPTVEDPSTGMRVPRVGYEELAAKKKGLDAAARTADAIEDAAVQVSHA